MKNCRINVLQHLLKAELRSLKEDLLKPCATRVENLKQVRDLQKIDWTFF